MEALWVQGSKFGGKVIKCSTKASLRHMILLLKCTRHVAYDDGEEEVLLLKNENWKFISEETNTLKKFHKKGSPIHYDMEKLYEGIIATGDLNFTSTEKPRRFPPSPTEHDPGVGVKPFSADLEGQRLSKDPINLDEEEHTTLCYSGQKEAGYGEKRKQSQVFGVQQEYVDFRKRQTRTSEDDLDRKTKPTDDYSIKNCLAVLESIEELSDAEKAKAIRILKCDQNREILLSLKNPTVRLLWIKGEIAP
ncbi:hypothetical protein QOZ80_5AG0380760 [Eleusine coracana subsp. coracana]|nr:hypothetical protein QOZ80_5AG0380760 [Eleusine coracana subsp. coracana]